MAHARNAHEHRPAARPGAARRKPEPAAPAVAYPAGYFLALVRQWNWPPRFEPQAPAPKPGAQGLAAAGRRGREVSIVNGVGWGNGTLVLPNTPRHLAPGMMRKVAS